MLKNNIHRLVLTLILSALVHVVVIFYEDEEKDNFISDVANSIVVNVELVAGNDSPDESLNKLQDKSENKQPKDSRLVSSPTDKSKFFSKRKSISKSSAEIIKKSEMEKQQDVTKSSKDQADEFLKLVYIEISKHKRYPYQARRQRREGRVKINFTLHPDGHVSEIVVMESSRFNVLDRAAQQAVESISPFAMAANYLHSETEFNVDIDYRLN